MLRHLHVAATFGLFLAGCGNNDGYRIVPVSGRVMLNGKPIAKAAVTFNPVVVPGSVDSGPSSIGVTDSDGRYTLKLISTTEAPGAVVGKHKVRITNDVGPYDPDIQQRPPRPAVVIPAKYARPEQLLDYEVPAAGTKAADFSLTSP